ncbi:PAS domain S-box protein [Halostella sp. JP-L12]|uniref:PAS domain S-box protein n=1 Tax=Halostella TaxID=1843185 RepID=UPI000EF80BF7|nr:MULTISPECIES: PAS domain S-box protein [Halostella]NHN46035.1 PAS domain S-box protein [Halostella sp. JP-L12]
MTPPEIPSTVDVGVGLTQAMQPGEPFPAVAGMLLFGLVGMVVKGDPESAIATLTRKVEQIRAGDYDVDLSIDRDDEVGRLYEAVDALVNTLRARERALRRQRRLLRAERERASSLFENTTDCVAHVDLTDDDVLVREVNERFEEVFGYDGEAIEGESIIDLVVPEGKLEESREMRREIRKEENAIDREVVRETADGTGNFLFRFVPINGDRTGPPDEGYAVYTDVTERRERERELERYREYTDHVLDAVDDVFYVLDAEGNVRRWNERLNGVTGYTDEEIEGMHAADFFDDPDRERVAEAVETAFETGRTRIEASYRTKDGERVPHEFVATPVTDPEGEPILVGIGRDITERRERERELELKDRAIEAAPIGITITEGEDGDNPIVYANEGFERVTGYAEEEALGRDCRFLQGEETADAPVERLREAIEADESESVELRNYRKDGTAFWNRVSVAPVEDEAGEVTHFVGFQEDVTDRKEKERRLRERERELERHREYTDEILDAIDDVFYVLDAEGHFRRWNESFTEVTGYDDEAVAEMNAAEFFEESDRERIWEATATAFETGSERVETELVTNDGERIPYEFIGTALRDPDGNPVLVGVGRDVSERKERERELERYETIIQAVGDPVYALDGEGYFEFVNDAIEPLTGYEPDDMIGEHVSTAMTDEDLAEARELTRELRADDDAFYRAFEMDLQTADGGAVETENHVALLPDDDGEFAGTAGIVRDITKRKRRERQLREANERLGAIVGASPAALVSTDLEGNVDLWNPAAERIFGWSADEVQGVRLPIVPDDRENEFAEVRERIDAGEVVTGMETKRRTRDGTLVDVSLSAAPLRDSDGEVAGLVAAIEDVSKRKEQERELERTKDLLEQAQRLAAVGGWELDVREDRPTVAWTDELYEIFDVPPGTDVALDEALNLYHPDDRDAIEDAVRTATESGESYDVEARIITRSGEERWVRSIGEPIVDGDEVVELRGSVQDITDRKRREHKLERTSELLEQSQRIAEVGGWTVDVTDEPENRLTEWTEKMFDIFELSRDGPLLVEKALEYYHPDDRDEQREAVERAIERGEAWDREARLITAAGNERWVRTAGEPVAEDGEVRRLYGAVQDITERKEREAELERTKNLLQQAGRIAKFGGWELDLRSDPPEMTWDDELYRIHGVSSGTEIDLGSTLELYHDDDRDFIERKFHDAIETGEGYDMEVRLSATGTDTRWVRAIGEPVFDDGEVVKLRGSVQDITEQKERELALRSLHDTARGLLNTEAAPEVAELVVDAAEDVVDVAGVGIYLFDGEATGLERVSCSSAFTSVCCGEEVVTAGDMDSPLWDSFVTNTQTVVDDPASFDGSTLFDDEVDEALLVPLGDHGVVVVAAAEPIDEGTRRHVETLAATTEAAFDRLESEESLRERDEELEAQNRRLRRQIQINEIIRSIDQSLIGAESQEEIERTVCERLVASEDIEFAWIGGPDVAGSELRPRARAGGDKEYLEAVLLDLDDPSPEPSVGAATTEEPAVVRNVVDRLKEEPWRKDALSRNFHSIVAVPLSVDEYSYGVLTVYADEPNAFGDLECEVFAELGESIANSITAVKTRQALYADAHLELTLRLDASDALLSRIARAADCEVEYEGMGTHASDETRLFFSTTGADADAVQRVLDDLVSVEESRLISEGDDRCLFEATVSRDLIASRLVRHGGSPRSMRADADGMEVVVDVPTTTDVREFIGMLRDAYPSVELAARRDVQRATHTRRDLVRSLFENLTDRQLEVLRTAYFSGFFEWPRESTGEDVAEMLGVSQPTVNRHLRLGQGRLLEQLFDDEESALTADGD